ncbi:MAG: glycosyl hydrolase [Candidatus Omnitrophota bacterium]|nr:glycosyl hydrolase [Candidatus Omnitrophota bacterium]
MKYCLRIAVFILFLITIFPYHARAEVNKSSCFTGAFLSDNPSSEDIRYFKHSYGKNPFLVMIFIDWNKPLLAKIVQDVYGENCVLFITWEPWDALKQTGIDYNALINGKYDKYITDFALSLKKIDEVVFLRFAHEANGDWYPWSAKKIGKESYIQLYRHVKDIFDQHNLNKVKWIFSVNWEDVPKEQNDFMLYYPGDKYVDYAAIDGYNWGRTKPWSKWMSFREIFVNRYNEITKHTNKPVLISEFSSTASGGDKAVWIREAMQTIKEMPALRGFIIFNLEKERDWSFPPESSYGKELKTQLRDAYFVDKKAGLYD